jgi:predicted DNA-binding transcriptional regulator AlpA
MEIKTESKYLTATNVYKYLGISKGFLYKLINSDPTFPKGLSLTSNKKVYDKNDLDLWLRNRSATIQG